MRRWWFLAILTLLPWCGFALRTTPLPLVAAHPVTEGVLSLDVLTDLSLQLSGTEADKLKSDKSEIAHWEHECHDKTWGKKDEDERAEIVLRVLFTHLKSYQTFQTRVDVLLDQGTYNCVSSAVIYMILARSVGLNVQAVETSDHAFDLVQLDNGTSVDVETTTPYGYNPGSKTEFTNSFGKTGYVYVPPGNYSGRKTISDRQLLGLLLQNRMAKAQNEGRTDDEIGLAVDRWTLEATPEAFRSLIMAFNNAAAPLSAQGDDMGGLTLIRSMVSLTGPVPEAKQLAWTFANNGVNRRLTQGQFDEAKGFLSSWEATGLLTTTQVQQTRSLVADWQVTSAIKVLSADEAAAKIDAAFQSGDLSRARREELLAYTYGQEVIRRNQSEGPSAAALYLSSLPDEVQAIPELAKAGKVYRYNWSVAVHNDFAKLWNNGKHDEALQSLRNALVQLPDSELLKRDLKTASAP